MAADWARKTREISSVSAVSSSESTFGGTFALHDSTKVQTSVPEPIFRRALLLHIMAQRLAKMREDGRKWAIRWARAG